MFMTPLDSENVSDLDTFEESGAKEMMVPILSLSSAADRVQHRRVSIQKIMKAADSSEHSRRNAWQIGEAFG